jgi:hypothetical protein
MVEEDATAVSVQMQSGMELDISRKHAAPKPNPPNAGPGHCKWQIMEGMAVCPLPCVVVSDLPPSTLPFWPLTALCLTLRQTMRLSALD